MTIKLAAKLDIHPAINFNDYRSVLCLNGQLPSQEFFAACPLPIFAADGAANLLAEFNILPSAIIGDLDSVKPHLRLQTKSIYLPDQNSSDFEKSLAYLAEQQCLPAIILGMNGGYLDHVLNNINLFSDSGCMFYAPPILGYVLKAGDKRHFTLPLTTKISSMGMPTANISSEGLKWELNDFDLAFPGKHSCFNRTIKPTVQLEVHNGTALIMIYEQPITDGAIY